MLRMDMYLPIGGTFKLVRVFGGDTLGRQQLAQRRVDLDLSRHEGIEFSWRSRVFGEFFLDNTFNDFTSVSNTVHLLGYLGRHAHDTILVTNDSISRSDRDNFNLLFSYVSYNVPQSVLKEPPRRRQSDLNIRGGVDSHRMSDGEVR